MTRPVFRFAPSPNGDLHLGHALSAFLNHDAAGRSGGRFLVRIEDIDGARRRPAFIARILDDLAWLGLAHETPVRMQSAHLADYRAALNRLAGMGLVYPSFMSRKELEAAAVRLAGGGLPARDPDGAILDPGIERDIDPAAAARRIAAGEPHALRLRMDLAADMAGPLTMVEEGDAEGLAKGEVPVDPRRWGDVVLARKDAPASYHLAVVVDDALQGVSHVIRGADLHAATAVHRLLQTLLGLPAPVYRHHRLMIGPDGRKLSKSLGSQSLRALRDQGATPADIRRLVGLD